ncbi:hypothetical protein LMG27177_04892 [Paraburkholderia fynbosensis]|uniref:Uncharacterized protein n=1 Tax=Paraburkholderia fynbosensis TaxID=1200993 RepID=A0A6J5GM55_9BURK|nr:hypothetical protein LMG27177_04892 [Paraburkholderia fynbosensis]
MTEYIIIVALIAVSAMGVHSVPALLFVLVGCIGLYVSFDSLQMTSAKINLMVRIGTGD